MRILSGWRALGAVSPFVFDRVLLWPYGVICGWHSAVVSEHGGGLRGLRAGQRDVAPALPAKRDGIPSKLETGRNERHRQRCILKPATPCCARLNRQKGDSNFFQLETGRNEKGAPLGGVPFDRTQMFQSDIKYNSPTRRCTTFIHSWSGSWLWQDLRGSCRSPSTTCTP